MLARAGSSASLHRHHERFISHGGLVCCLRFQKCIVFSVSPPIPPQHLSMQPLLASAAAASFNAARDRHGHRVSERRHSAAKLGGLLPFSSKPASPAAAAAAAAGEGGPPSEDADGGRAPLAGPSAIAAHALQSAACGKEVERVTGVPKVDCIQSHEKLAEVMRAEGARSRSSRSSTKATPSARRRRRARAPG